MDIKTKYNIGDKIYVITNFSLSLRQTKALLPRMQIRSIDINFGKREEPIITYHFNGTSALEHYVYADVSEALKVLDAQEEI